MHGDPTHPNAPTDSLRRVLPRAGKQVRLRKSKVDRPSDPNEAYRQAEQVTDLELNPAANFGDPLHPDALAGLPARPARR